MRGGNEIVRQRSRHVLVDFGMLWIEDVTFWAQQIAGEPYGLEQTLNRENNYLILSNIKTHGVLFVIKKYFERKFQEVCTPEFQKEF